ncbi:MAG: ABC transporter permease subunit [Gemmatimonadaceae bacterium]
MPSPDTLRLLWRKEVRELATARAYWLLLLALGPLVGHAYMTAVESYAEASGSAGGPAALSQGLSPLDGFVVPVFGAYGIAATLLLPFVAIRLLAAEKENGGLALLLQAGVRPVTITVVKLCVVLLAWLVALLPGLIALALWGTRGGHLAAREVAVVLAGHLLRALFTGALALAAAALTESASTAAIVALGATLASWALDFMGAVNGGVAQRLARFTPEAALRVFERGELSASVFGVTAVATAFFVGVAAIALRAPEPRKRLAARALVLLLATAVVLPIAARARASVDLSEDRRNSFSPADERALRSIALPIDVEVHLAPEDPRLADLERSVLRKLQRTRDGVSVRNVSAGGTGLFAADPHYGEVWYSVGPRRAMTRSTTGPIVLETIYELAGVAAPRAAAPPYPGYPLVLRAGVQPYIFFVAWPMLVLLMWWALRRPPLTRAFSL